MAELDELEVEGGEKPRKPAPKPRKIAAKNGGGGGGAGQIVAWVIAVAALGLSVYLFMQLGALNRKLATAGPLPKGSPEGQQAAQQETQPEGNAESWTVDPFDVTYELGEFTSKTTNGTAQMTLALEIESFYRQAEWEAYSAEMKQYEEELLKYFDFKAGKVDASGKALKQKKQPGEAAAMPGVPLAWRGGGSFILAVRRPVVVNAAEGEKKPVELTPPEEPARPRTVMEFELEKQKAAVRDAVNDVIITFSSEQLNSPDGREEFKQKVAEAVNGVIDRHFGSVKKVLVSNLVTA